MRAGDRFTELGAVPSIDDPGSCDDVLAETLSGYQKAELIYGPARRGSRKTVDDGELATLGWLHRPNTCRLLGYLEDAPPAEFEGIISAGASAIRFHYDALLARDEVSLDITWLRAESPKYADELLAPKTIAREIVEDRTAGPAEFEAVEASREVLVDTVDAVGA